MYYMGRNGKLSTFPLVRRVLFAHNTNAKSIRVYTSTSHGGRCSRGDAQVLVWSNCSPGRSSGPSRQHVVTNDGLVATRTDPDARHPCSGELLDAQHVGLRVGRQRLETAAVADVLPPAGHLLVHGYRVVDVGLCHRHVIGTHAVDDVTHTDRHSVQPGEDVELGEEVVGDAVDPGGVPGNHRVEPPAATSPAGGDPDFAAGLAQVLAHVVLELGGKGPGADARRVRLQNSQDRIDAGGADAGAHRSTAGGGVGGGDEGVRAVVHVEQGALAALQQNRLATLEGLVELAARVGNAVLETLRLLQNLGHHLIGVQRLAVVDLGQHLVLELQGGLHLLSQDLLVQHVGNAHTDAGNLVLVGRADAAAGGADLGLAEEALAHLVDGYVVRHQQMRVRGKAQP